MQKTWDKIKTALYNHSDLIVITILGVFLRLKTLARDDFWYDEAFTGLAAKIPLEEFITILKRDPHPPLFLILTRVWAFLFGSSDFSLRLLPAIFGILALILIFLTTKELFGKKPAIITLFLAAVSPFLIAYSQEARSYSLFAFMVLLAFYFCVKKRKLAFTLATIILLNVHFMGMLFLPGLFISFLFFNYFLEEKKISSSILKKIPYLIPIIIFALYLVGVSLEKKEVLNIAWARDSSFLFIPRSFIAYLFGVKSRLAGVDYLVEYKLPINILYIGYTAFFLFLGGMAIQIRKANSREKLINLVILANLLIPQILLITYGIYKGDNLYVERYFIPSSLFLFILLGTLLAQRMKFESAAIILVLYIVILSKQISPGYYQGMKTLAKELKYIPNELVLTKPIDYIIAKYYMYEMRKQVLLFDPENPESDYTWWPYISAESGWTPEKMMESTDAPIFAIPKDGFIPKDFDLVSYEGEYGDYNLYLRAN